MATIDIITLGAIAIFAIIGLFRGFTRAFIGLLGLILVFYLASILCAPLAKAYDSWFGDAVDDKFNTWLVSVEDSLPGDLDILTSEQDWSLTSNVDELQSALGLPSFLRGVLNNVVNDAIEEHGVVFTASMVLARYITPLFLRALSYLTLVVLFGIGMIIIKFAIMAKVKAHAGLYALDKVGGVLFGALKAVLILCFLYTLITCTSFSLLEPVRAYLNEQMIASANGIGISKWLYESVFVDLFVKLIF
ncbi:MAG: CvpA family protein [Clostridia bacterium]|nr:CvpA family protein [Clostridia bacterium]